MKEWAFLSYLLILDLLAIILIMLTRSMLSVVLDVYLLLFSDSQRALIPLFSGLGSLSSPFKPKRGTLWLIFQVTLGSSLDFFFLLFLLSRK